MNEESSIFTPRRMDRVVRRMPKVHTFIKSTFFKRVKTFVEKKIEVDFVKGNRALAPFIHPKKNNQTIPNMGFQTKDYTPPLIGPDKITTVEDLLQRHAGESQFSGRTPAERAVEKITADFRELDEMITRREEWMATQALFTGKIPIQGNGIDEEIDFMFTNKEELPKGKTWNDANTDPLDDLDRWFVTVQKEGFISPNICIMARDVAKAFIRNKKVMDLLDVRNYDLAVISPRQLSNGVKYVGSINGLGLDCYTYNEWYLDNWTDPENPIQRPLVPDGYLGLFSTHANYSMYYGGITILDGRRVVENFRTVEGSRVPDSWTERNPARRFVQLFSAPLPVPHEVNSWYIAKVL